MKTKIQLIKIRLAIVLARRLMAGVRCDKQIASNQQRRDQMCEQTIVAEQLIQGATYLVRSVACQRIVTASCFLVFAVQLASAQILIGNVSGNAWDPLVGANPFFAFPGETQFRAISVGNNPFALSLFTGPVRLSVTCCLDQTTRSPVAASLTLQMSPYECRPLVLTMGDSLSRPLISGERPLRSPLPSCPTDGTATVNVSPFMPAQAFVVATADTAATPGRYIATVRADSALGTSTMEMFFSVVPATLPPDGLTPACPPPTIILPLSSVTPPPFIWKRSSPARTTYAIGAAFTTGPGDAGAGMSLTFSNVSTTGPIPPGISVVNFTNTVGWPVAVRTVDSRDCAAPSQQIVVRQGETRSLSFNSGSTTTLVFSKSTCRAWIDWYDCWGQSALGLDDLVTLGEESFWTLFGGRRVDIATAGNWGRLPRPDSAAVIRTP